MKFIPQKMRWGVERRLEFIEFRAFWEGGVNRTDLKDQFGISAPQASADLSAYQELAPGNIEYDSSEKRYVPTAAFVPRLITPAAEDYLRQLATAEGDGDSTIWVASLPAIDVIPVLRRRVEPTVLREMIKAMRTDSSISVLYQSMSDRAPDSAWRTITPHALASDGARWHVRAFCHKDFIFKDFLLSRCQETGQLGSAGASQEMDKHWGNYFEVVMEPNPALSSSQRDAIAKDYEMTDGRLVLSVRRALLFYLNKQWRLDYSAFDVTPKNNPLVVVNRDEFEAAIKAASFN
jgi:hypothetical protein